MNINALFEILEDCSTEYRKGEPFIQKDDAGAVKVLEIYAMDHESQAPDGLEMVDVHFMKIGVDKAKAEARKDELIALLKDYPKPAELMVGPSYIGVGATIGDQSAAFQLFAIGKVIGMWDIVTPATMGIEGAQADEMAGMGYVLMTGWQA